MKHAFTFFFFFFLIFSALYFWNPLQKTYTNIAIYIMYLPYARYPCRKHTYILLYIRTCVRALRNFMFCF